jgi:SAM-dependent methyltransferase
MSSGTDAWLYWYWGKESEPEPQIRELVDVLRKEKVSRVLDLGCGTGRHSLFLARMGFHVSGFDQSSAAINRARALSSEAMLGIDLRVWDMHTFPYPYVDRAFDAVIATKVIHHAKKESIKMTLAEITRILKKRSVIFLEVPERRKIVRLESEGEKHEVIEEGTYVPLYGDERGIPHHYFSRDELLSMLSDFRIINLEIRKEHYCLTGIKKSSRKKLKEKGKRNFPGFSD